MEKCSACDQEITPGKNHIDMRDCLTTITRTLDKVEKRLTKLETKWTPTYLIPHEEKEPDPPTASDRADKIK